MLLKIDFMLEQPIYMQIRNQIVVGIAEGKLVPGERLPTIRRLAEESGINMMTVNKAYQLLKQEGYIVTDRRNGAIVSQHVQPARGLTSESVDSLRLVIAEAYVSGAGKEEILKACHKILEDLEDVDYV